MKKDKYMNEENIKKIRLNQNDKKILKALEPVVEAIAKLFGDNCEVVLHSLEDLSKSVIKIENGHVTGRKIGSPITDLGIKILRSADTSQKNVVGSYFSKNRDGKMLKSVTALLRNSAGKPIGLLCINIDLSVSLIELLKNFTPTFNNKQGGSPEYFMISVEELVRKSLEEVISNVNKQRKIPLVDKNKLIVFELYKKGIFDIKGAIDLIAQEIGVSRYTIYNYIREARIKFNKVQIKF